MSISENAGIVCETRKCLPRLVGTHLACLSPKHYFDGDVVERASPVARDMAQQCPGLAYPIDGYEERAVAYADTRFKLYAHMLRTASRGSWFQHDCGLNR